MVKNLEAVITLSWAVPAMLLIGLFKPTLRRAFLAEARKEKMSLSSAIWLCAYESSAKIGFITIALIGLGAAVGSIIGKPVAGAACAYTFLVLLPLLFPLPSTMIRS